MVQIKENNQLVLIVKPSNLIEFDGFLSIKLFQMIFISKLNGKYESRLIILKSNFFRKSQNKYFN
jgi:hypothetical protein